MAVASSRPGLAARARDQAEWRVWVSLLDEVNAETETGPWPDVVPEPRGVNDDGAPLLAGVTFTLGPDGVMDEEVLVGGRNNTFSVGGNEYVVDVKSRSPRLIGSVKTKTPVVDLGGGRAVAVEATFDLAVAAR